MDFWQITHDETFRATHEIGHLIIAEQFNIGWDYVTLDHPDADKGGCFMHDDIDPTEDNCIKFVLMKMAGEALVKKNYGTVFAMISSIKYDRADVEEFLATVYPQLNILDCKRCINRAVLQNLLIFRQPQIKKIIEIMVPALITSRTITRQEFLELTRESE